MLSLVAYCKNEITIKKSRFLTEGFPITQSEEVKQILKAQREKHADARHVVHAFIVGNKGEVQGASDDGEPKGTAGRPALAILKHASVTNIMVTITRWFGGILLGTGGLVKAYQDSTKSLLNIASLKEIKTYASFKATTSYKDSTPLLLLLEKHGALITKKDYTEGVCYSFEMLEENKTALLSLIKERIRAVTIE